MTKRLLFSTYSFLEQWAYLILDILPAPVRDLCFRLALKQRGAGCNIDYHVYFRYPWKVSVGRAAWINRGCKFYASYHVPDAEIIIGNHVAIGPDVTVFSAGHDISTRALADTAQTVTFGDYAWIGGRSVILPGVQIGEGAVVGAGSVVTKSVPAYHVVAGNPAAFIRMRDVTA